MTARSHHIPGPDPLDIQVGLTLRRLRKARAITQTELGGALGITFQQIQKYERGTNRISASMLVRAARALGIQPGDLLPPSDADPLPASACLLGLSGAEELLQAYATIRSPHRRRAVLALVKTLQEQDASQT